MLTLTKSFVLGSKGLRHVSSKTDENCDRQSAHRQTQCREREMTQMILQSVPCNAVAMAEIKNTHIHTVMYYIMVKYSKLM